MMQQRLCRVTGFDPHPEAIAALAKRKSAQETYLPYAVGDGGEHVLNICRGIGFASLLQPHAKTLTHFPNFSELGRVINHLALRTKRLDEIDEIPAFDLLKIDIQGGELAVFQNGRRKLAAAVAIQTEVSFVPLYEKQPVFGDIDLELRSLGFVPHMFAAINKRMIAPMLGADPAAAINQLVEADVVYVRNFVEADTMQSEQLKHLALIAHHCYGSFDLALNCVHHLTSRGEIPPDSKNRYVGLLQAQRPKVAGARL
ncbi:FkbM family methyltransferase [Tardiphaga alba]|uniref:FkbM family methyltransferase n=2 Tax=Tardiphaga alba TaxID=340268 RepID=A0ABX8AGK2_9BRAD|nr:FkbM family methyltransferase [Tardiphaga alba]